jgi:acetyl esterase/lipase
MEPFMLLTSATRVGWVAIFCCLLSPFGIQAADDPKIEPDVVYGHKDGLALTFDVLRPAKPNGAAVVYLQSGGWYSPWREPKELVPASLPLLSKGFTVFIVRHGSAPKYNIPEAVADVRRCVRYIRLNADKLQVDADRLGVLGGSAGGHLTCVLATTADEGDPAAKDEVLRQSSRIAAGVALYPPTDLREWVTNPPEEIRKLAMLKPPLSFDAAKAPDYSPVLHASAKTAPLLMIHGDKDPLVPIVHSQNLAAVLEKEKAIFKLVTVTGAGHAFSPQQNNSVVLPEMVGWFEKQRKVDWKQTDEWKAQSCAADSESFGNAARRRGGAAGRFRSRTRPLEASRFVRPASGQLPRQPGPAI